MLEFLDLWSSKSPNQFITKKTNVAIMCQISCYTNF